MIQFFCVDYQQALKYIKIELKGTKKRRKIIFNLIKISNIIWLIIIKNLYKKYWIRSCCNSKYRRELLEQFLSFFKCVQGLEKKYIKKISSQYLLDAMIRIQS